MIEETVDMMQLAQKAKTRVEQVTGLKASGVTGMAHDDEGNWVVTLELLEKKSIPDAMDILGIYEVKMNAEGGILDFARTRLRKRGDTSEG